MRMAPFRVRRSMAGITLVELLLALAGTAFVALAIAMMMLAVTYGTDSSKDMRFVLVKDTVITARVGAALRGSKMILEAGDGYVILWMHDGRNNGFPNLSEIRLIERDAASNELVSHQAEFSSSLTEEQLEAADTQYDLTDNFRTLTNALKATAAFPGDSWAVGVTSLTFSLNHATTQSATAAEFQVGYTANGQAQRTINVAALRN